MEAPSRPTQARVMSVLLASSGVFTLWLGTMASAYYVPGAVLFVAAALLWSGRALRLFKGLLLASQFGALVMLLMLLTPLAAWLHLPKLEIAGAMLLLHLAAGGPLMALLSIPLLASMHFSRVLPDWFGRRSAGPAGTLGGRVGAVAP